MPNIVTSPAIATTYRLSQAELLKRLDPKGDVADIAEVLNETNEILQDIPFKEGNLPTGDEQTIRTGLPSVYWRQMNRGVPASHSTVATVQETTATMDARAEVDEKVIKLNGYDAKFLFQEEKAFIESMGQKFAHELFYGNRTKHSEGFSGLATRYSTTNKTKADNAKNVIDCGGQGGSGKKLTSIYIVAWGDMVYSPYPKGTKLGLDKKDLGFGLIDDDKGNKFLGHSTIYDWDVGLMIKDWRHVVRLCNIDVDDLINGTGIGSGEVKTGSNLILKLQNALALIPASVRAKCKMYMNSDVHAGLNTLAVRCQSNVIETMKLVNNNDFGNTAWKTFSGVPMRQVDQISNNETKVV